MKTRSSVRGIALLAFLTLCVAGSAQTFTVVSRSTPGGDLLKLDQSLDVVYNVSASGLTQPVVPVLVPTTAADAVNVTWQGTGATTSLSNLTFNIHVYDDEALCSQTLSFELRFYSAQFAGYITATPSNTALMRFATSGAGQITLTDLIVETPTLPWPLTSLSPNNHFLSVKNVPLSTIRDPANRIYWWCDYNLNNFPWTGQFLYFLYGLNGNNCTASAVGELSNLTQVEDEVINQTVTPAQTVPLAPYGGAGTSSALGQGINLFDVTDIVPNDGDCSGTIQNSINYTTGGPFYLIWDYGGFGAVVRRFALYVGRESGCSAVVNNFGAPPAPGSFQVEDFFLSSYGTVQARLKVPSAWGSTTTLGTAFRLQWYLRTASGMTPLGGETQSLNLNFASGLAIDAPQNYFLEARIRRTDTDAMVSTTSRDYSHNVAYAVQNVSFTGAEQVSITGAGPDAFLDPGEIISFPVVLTVPGGGTLPSLTYDHGLVLDSNANGTVDAADTFIDGDTPVPGGVNIRFLGQQTSGSSSATTLTISFELLTAHALPQVWFYADVTRNGTGGTASTYRRYYSLKELFGSERDINAELTSEQYLYDFSSTPGTPDWAASVSTTSNGTSGLWAHSTPGGGWIGNGGTDVSNADEVYRLASPVFPIGTDSRVDFNHLPQFSFNQSGGFLEYRARTGSGSWTQWQNFVDDFCSTCGYYNSIPFPALPSSYLSNEKVWMSNEEDVQSVLVNIPNSLGNTRTELQFRFVFADPSLVDTGRSDGPTHWEVYNFNYRTTRLTEDNIFGVDVDQLTWDACDSPRLVFEQWAPVALSNLTFEWYASLANLYDDLSAGETTGAAGAEVPFNPSTNGTYTYYVRIKYLGTERIVRVVVNRTEPCVNVCLTMQEAVDMIRADASVTWPLVKKVTECVEVVNRICK